MPEAEPWIWPLLVFLLFASGAFSASETALFSLGSGERGSAGAGRTGFSPFQEFLNVESIVQLDRPAWLLHNFSNSTAELLTG